jgi:PIN domain nuclease of toxin-antitoxin system
MTYLLDTHAFLWFVTQDNKLSSTAKHYIENESNYILLSLASIWELSIKFSQNKLPIPTHDLESYVSKEILNNSMRIFNIRPRHAFGIIYLPFHHKDPFDRIIISQSKIENIPVISKDIIFDKYEINRIW